MRPRLLVVLGLATATTLFATPQPAAAQFNPLGLFGALTRPFGAIFGGHSRRMDRRAAPGSSSYMRHESRRSRAARLAATTAGAASLPRAEADAQLGSLGPQAWPSAFQDVLGYVFQPREYEPRLRAHGQSDIVATIFAPPAAYAATRPVQVASTDRPETSGSGSSGTAASRCGDAANADWPMERITQELSLTEAQRATLDRLRAAVTDAIQTIRAACRDDTGLSPPERVRAMEDMLWAVRDGAILIRGPLKAFYDSLSESQRARFIARPPVTPAGVHAEAPATPGAAPRSEAAAATSARQPTPEMMKAAAQLCGPSFATDRFGARFERIVRPTREQRASLEQLRHTSEQMGQMLTASCPLFTPPRPVDRLDLADGRLTSLIFAASTMSLALSDFYGQLNDDQRARFDTFSR